jgi:APA family basic amino acid/polyamine antiporter
MGLTGATIFYVNYFLVPIYAALMPGADLAIASLLSAVFAIPAYVIYAGFGTAMPRAGGDYIYQSRALVPAIGFAVVIGFWVMGSGAFLATGLLATLILSGFYPVFVFGGLAGAAQWVSSPTGLVILGIAAAILATALGVAGIKWVARVQKFIILPAFIISGITIPLILATTNPTAFQASFNHYTGALFGNSSVYHTVTAAYPPVGINWTQTIILGMVLGDTLVMFSVASAPLLGEIKGANNFRGVFWAYFLGGTITAVLFMFPASYFLQTALGKPFLQAIAQAGLFGSPPVPFFPTFAILTDMASSNYFLIILASLGYIAVGYYITAYDITWVSRIWLATSLDGLMPRVLGSTNHRTHAPLVALVLAGIITIAYIPIEAYLPSGFTIVGNVGIYTSAALPFVTAVAAVAFKYRQKSIYAASPIAKYRGLLQVSGAILAVLLAIVLYLYLFYAPLAVSLGPIGDSILAGQLIGWAIWFFAYRAYQKSKAVDVDLAFREIPAE